MSPDGWLAALLGLARRVLLVTVVGVLVFGAIGFALGGLDGARTASLWGLLAGGISIPVILEAMVATDGDGINEETRAAYFRQKFGLETKD